MNLIHNFYIELLAEIGLLKDTILKVVKPLYSIPEASNYWFSTYYKLHTNNLSIKTSTFNPYLLF